VTHAEPSITIEDTQTGTPAGDQHDTRTYTTDGKEISYQANGADVKSAGVPHPRRIVLHRRIGEFQETAYADHLQEIAAELAVHFQEGRDYSRAIHYRRLSAGKALVQYANRNAQEHLARALALVEYLPENERAEIEATLRQERGSTRRAMGR
jgi:hypothetical protein